MFDLEYYLACDVLENALSNDIRIPPVFRVLPGASTARVCEIDGFEVVIKSGMWNNTSVWGNEVAGYCLSRAMGLEAPETVARSMGFGGSRKSLYSVQRWIPSGCHEPCLLEDYSESILRRLTLLDFVMANADRHERNVLWCDDKLLPIDHAYCFPDYDTNIFYSFPRNYLHRKYKGEMALSDDELALVSDLWYRLPDIVGNYVSVDAINSALSRIRILMEVGQL